MIFLEKIIKDYSLNNELNDIIKTTMERYTSSQDNDKIPPLSDWGYWDYKRVLKRWKQVDEEAYYIYINNDLYSDRVDILRLVDNFMSNSHGDGYDLICDLFDVGRIYNVIIDSKYDDKRRDYRGVSEFIDRYDKSFDEAVEAMIEEKEE